MVHQATTILDPNHTSCIGGRTVITCRSCAGNAPRGAICTSCSGRGFNIFMCAHCNPAAAATATANGRSASSLSTTASESSTPASLSRSSSTSVSSYNNTQTPGNSWRRFGDRDGGSRGGRLETNSNQPRGS